MEIKTKISFGYEPLLKTFFRANDLIVTCIERFEENNEEMPLINTNFETKEVKTCTTVITSARRYTTLIFCDDSDTAEKITFMSYRHLGFENMLCDYLIRCGIPANRLSIGSYNMKRDMEELDKKWEEHRKLIGLAR